jgi:hypothetical protein
MIFFCFLFFFSLFSFLDFLSGHGRTIFLIILLGGSSTLSKVEKKKGRSISQ